MVLSRPCRRIKNDRLIFPWWLNEFTRHIKQQNACYNKSRWWQKTPWRKRLQKQIWNVQKPLWVIVGLLHPQWPNHQMTHFSACEIASSHPKCDTTKRSLLSLWLSSSREGESSSLALELAASSSEEALAWRREIPHLIPGDLQQANSLRTNVNCAVLANFVRVPSAAGAFPSLSWT